MEETAKSTASNSSSFEMWEEVSDEEAAVLIGGRTWAGRFFSAASSAAKTAINDKWDGIKKAGKDFLGIGSADIGTLPTGETADKLLTPLPISFTVNFLNKLFG